MNLSSNYTGVANNDLVSVIITDSNKLIMWANEQFTKMTGYSLAEVRGKKPSLLQGRNTERTTVNRIRTSLEKKKPFHDRITNYRKNGEEYTCALTIHPIFNSDGDVCNFIAFEVDNNFVDPNDIQLMKISVAGKKSYLTDSEELDIYFRITDLFRREKPYLDPNLCLHDISIALDTNDKYLSQVINHQTGRNFRYFVNQFRVQEFERIVSTGEMSNYTLFSIGQNCGFKNKSTFHNVILNHTGMTPKGIVDKYAESLD